VFVIYSYCLMALPNSAFRKPALAYRGVGIQAEKNPFYKFDIGGASHRSPVMCF
jgi:hypothetical protein